MAKFQINGPDGKRYEIEAPDSANQDEVLSYFRSNFEKQAQSANVSGVSPDLLPAVQQEVGKRKAATANVPGNSYLNTFNQGVPFINDMSSVFRATKDTITGENPELDWNQKRQVHRAASVAIDNDSMKDAGLFGHSLKTTGGIAATLPLMGVGGATAIAEPIVAEAAKPIASGATNALMAYAPQLAKEAPKLATMGGLFSAATAFGESPEDDLSKRLEHANSAIIPGAFMGVALPGAFGGALAAKQGRAQLAAERAQPRIENAEAFDRFGITPFGPAITDGRVAQGASEKIADSVIGGPLRRSAQMTMDDIANSARSVIGRETDGMPVNDIGERVQGVLKRNLTEPSIPYERIKGMSSDDLQLITGPMTEAGFKPPKPKVEPVRPQDVLPVKPNYDAFPPENEIASSVKFKPKLPSLDELPYAAEHEQAITHARTMADELARKHDGIIDQMRRPLIDEIMQMRADAIKKYSVDDSRSFQGFPYENVTGSRSSRSEVFSRIKDHKGWSDQVQAVRRFPGDEAVYPETWSKYAEAMLPLDDLHALQARYQKVHQIDQELQGLRNNIDKFRAQERTSVAQGEAERQARYERLVSDETAKASGETERLRFEEQQRRARSRAEEEAANETQRLRMNAISDAAEQTRQNQLAADRAWSEQPSQFKVGGTRETYPTEFAAGYELADRATPNIKTNLLGKADNYLNQGKGFETNTSRLIEDFDRIARTKMEVPFMNDPAFGASGFEMTPELSRFLDRNLGKSISGKLRMLAEARNPQAPNQADIKTMIALQREIGSAIGDLKRSQRMGESRSEDHAMLARLYDAIKTDVDGFMRASGAAGDRAANVHANLSDAFKDHADTMKRPLAKVFGDKVAPVDGLNRLVKAATDGDLQTLRAYMRVMSEKDNPNKGAGAIIAAITDNARDLTSFSKGMAKLKKESRDVLFTGENGRKYRADLEALEKLAARMEPYRQAVETGGKGLQLGNSLIGIELAGHAIHALGHPGSFATTVGGGYLLGKFLSSPRYVNWLRHVPDAARYGTASPAFIRHLARLGGITGENAETSRAIKSVVTAAILPGPANATFAGENAKTADKQALSRAKEMETAGANRDAIWKETGWFKQPDGKWRFEIDDSGAEAAPGFNEDMDKTQGKSFALRRPLDSHLEHDALFKAYPELKKLPSFVGQMPKGYEDTRGFFDGQKVAFNNTPNPKKRADTSIMLHEAQHAIQKREGFQYGRITDDDHEYDRQPGEAEAFNVSARRKMTAEQRREVPPWDTLEVPENEIRWSGKTTAWMAKAKAADGKAAPIFTSLEAAPSPKEVADAAKAGVQVFDIDLNRPESADAVKAIKSAGGKVTAYHVGGGGGRAWKGISENEQVNKYDTPESLAQLTNDVKGLVAKGADSIHFDNTHRMSGKRLEQIADAIKAGGAGFVAKNNADKWNLVMRRRPDLKPDYAVIEAAMHDADETQAAYDLHARGVPVYIIGFKKTLKGQDESVSPEYAKDYQKKNPWAHVILMESEEAYDQRTQHRLD